MKINPILKFAVIPLAVFFVFNKLITKFINDIIATPFFFDIEKSIFNDVLILIIISLFIYKLISKIRYNVATPVNLIHFLIVYSFIYIYYRNSNDFYFVDSYFFENLKLLDYFLPFSLGIVLLKIFESILNSSIFESIYTSKNKFSIKQINDEPTIITESNDILNRLKIVKSIEEIITSKSSPNESYPIGIVAEWGNGKTTILKTLIKRFDDKNEYVAIEFNPWKCSSPEKIIETFFKLLREKLSPYSFTINNKIGDYISNITTIAENDLFSTLDKLFEKFTKAQNLEYQYENIKNEIIKIDRKIIITIDDLDRLNKKEIYEVIRLIRNTANFPNVFFIVAYDRAYVTKAIEEINSHNVHLFLEKIFQIEITLNPIKIETIESELIIGMHSILKGKSKEGFDYFIEQNRRITKIGSLINRKMPFVKDLRDVKRFLNSFEMNYRIIGDEIYIPDLVFLELLRFKTPEFYNHFKNNYTAFVTESKLIRNTGDYNPNFIVLSTLENETSKTKLEDYLTKNSYPESGWIVEIMKALFINSPKTSRFDKEKINEHLSISYPSKFNRYFDWDLNGALSNQKFDEMRISSIEEFKKSISDLCTKPELIKNLRERFQQIQFFESKEDFEKTIQAIFHFANLDNPGITGIFHKKFIDYNDIHLSIIFSRKSIQQNFYDSKPEKLKDFLESLIKTDSDKYLYNNDFVTYLYEKEFDRISDFFESKNNILEIIYSNFENTIKKSTKLSMPLIWHYNNCQSNGFIDHRDTRNSSEPEESIENKSRELLKKFVIENDIDGFIRACIDKNLDDKYQLNSKFLFEIMGGRENAEGFFAKPEEKSKYREEFNKFINDSFIVGIRRKEGFPRDYFKVIPVEKPFFEE